MKMKINNIEVEGTPEECATFKKYIDEQSTPKTQYTYIYPDIYTGGSIGTEVIIESLNQKLKDSFSLLK